MVSLASLSASSISTLFVPFALSKLRLARASLMVALAASKLSGSNGARVKLSQQILEVDKEKEREGWRLGKE
jgi:hypothetical protein